ncbi:hypothetical protein IQ07DRAFT_9724 [Pyrenochaeta sp. DS3sAY3a]|nr:hypothetical protein IQ07DRAFT_9724 [Pyrenochaeta sp. DS3sAY3a]
MGTPTRLLFPSLPAEARNLIYSHLSTPDGGSVATNTGLPLQSKTYKCNQSTTKISPVHFGSIGLLGLQKYDYLEAHEYYTWLLGNHVELQIRVILGGRVNNFVQAHWDKAMEGHLRKLQKTQPWLTGVSTYDIHILWDSKDVRLQSKKKKKTIGDVPDAMTKTLTLLMREGLKKREGRVNLRLYLESRFSAMLSFSQIQFSSADYLSRVETLDGFREYNAELLVPLNQKEPREQWVPHSIATRYAVLVVKEESVETSFARPWKRLWFKKKG